MVRQDVYVTDWNDASRVPASAGSFGVDAYIQALLDAIRHIGPDVHVMAVCQPAPLVMATVALLSQNDPKAAPRSMILMGGPVDPAAAPTIVTQFAENRPLSWFERHLIAAVPYHYEGRGRRVYPGFMQLSAFILMNPGRHVGAHFDLFNHLVVGDGDSAEGHRRFYDEYLSVADVAADFYLETVDRVFKRRLLPRGEFVWNGETVDTRSIAKTALMTVEGELDDISAPGQTLAAHDMCSGIPGDRHLNHVQFGTGHYGIFNGRRWRDEIAPQIEAFIRSV